MFTKTIDRALMVAIAAAIILFILWPYIEVFGNAFYTEELGFNLTGILQYIQSNHRLILDSIWSAFLVMLLATALSTVVSVVYMGSSRWMQTLLMLILVLTLISPPYVLSLAYINLFGRRGLITYGLLNMRWNPYGIHGIVLMQSLGAVSFSSILLINSIKNIDFAVIESAKTLGARSNRIILTIILPLIKNGIVAVALLNFIRALADFGTPHIIGGNFTTLASEGYLSMIAYGDSYMASIINVIIFIPGIIAFYFYLKANRNMSSSTSNYSIGQREEGLNLSGGVFQVFKLIALLFVLIIGLQYTSIILEAFTQTEKQQTFFTLANIKASLPYLNPAMFRSIAYALIAGLGATLLSFLLIYYSRVRQKQWMKHMELIATLPSVVPGTFFGLGYLLAFQSYPLNLTGTAAIVVINMLFKLLPTSTKIAAASVEQIHPDIMDATQDLGGQWYHELFGQVFPLAKSGLFLSFIEGFISTMTTVGSIIFLVTPGQKVLTLILFELIGSGKYDLASTIALWMIVISLIFTAGAYALLGLFRKKGSYETQNQKLA